MTSNYAVLTDMFGIFNEVIAWMTEAIQAILGIFYDGSTNKFTVLGIIALVALAISIVFLMVAVVKSFIRFR